MKIFKTVEVTDLAPAPPPPPPAKGHGLIWHRADDGTWTVLEYTDGEVRELLAGEARTVAAEAMKLELVRRILPWRGE